MSILLSAYFQEGIVFAADKNITISSPNNQYVEEGKGTKVLSWPREKAVVGYCGLGELAGLDMSEWMRQFIALNRDFVDMDELAEKLIEKIQIDFNHDYPKDDDINIDKLLIIHLGGYKTVDGFRVPVMYYIRNSKLEGIDFNNKKGGYFGVERNFKYGDQFYMQIIKAGGIKYPQDVFDFIVDLEERGKYLWFNNGLNFREFNIFKRYLWMALAEIRKSRKALHLTADYNTNDKIAFCRMAVGLYNSFFESHHRSNERIVGGGVDHVFLPWNHLEA